MPGTLSGSYRAARAGGDGEKSGQPVSEVFNGAGGFCLNSDLNLEQLYSEAEYFAERILENFWDSVFPVDVVSIAAEIPIVIRYVDFPGETIGLIIKRANDRDPTIFLDSDMTSQRRRFTIAHEIGHYVEHYHLEKKASDVPFWYDDPEKLGTEFHRARIPTPSGDPDTRRSEQFADAFAHALLMPSWEVETFAGLGMTRESVARYFGVSVTTMLNRLRMLGIEL